MKNQEMLVVVDVKESVDNFSFPISISPFSLKIPRNADNEREYCHLTCLIIPIIGGNKILVIDKAEKVRAKAPEKYRAGLQYLDIIGGHFTADKVPAAELNAGKLSYKTALRQSFKEVSEELKIRGDNKLSFVQDDLVFLGFCPYQSESNKELSLAFGLALAYPLEYYLVYDDMIINGRKKNIVLSPPKAYSFEELSLLWNNREDNKDKYEIQDGLGRLLDKWDLPGIIGETEFPVRGAAKINLSALPDIAPVTGGLKPFDIDATIRDMLRGYSEENNLFVCMECEYTSANEIEVQKHWERYHNADKESRFINLLNSSIADFSYIEKLVGYRMFLGMSNKEIAEELNISAVTTVNSIRQRFKGFYERSKIMLLLCDMLPPFKKNNKAIRDELIPSLNPETLNVESFYTKEDIHSKEIAALHPTVIILLCQKDENNAWTFLVKNKADMVTSLTPTLIKDRHLKMLDFCGGHIEIADIAVAKTGASTDNHQQFIGQPISDTYILAAKRELTEEVSFRGGASVDPTRLIEFCEIRYNGPTLFGLNNEISKIFIYVLPGIPTKYIRTFDVWEDPLTGKKVRKEYVCEFKTLPQLMHIYNENKNSYMDGALRIIDKLNVEPEFEKRLFAVLEKEYENIKESK